MKAGIVRLTIAAVLVTTLVSCTTRYRNHGYIPLPADLEKIKVGRDTRETVFEAVGTPAAKGVLEDTVWYYVESRYQHYAYRDPVEIERELLSISFGSNGRVSNIEHFALEDGKVIILSRRVTDTKGRSNSFMRQLLGNIGNTSLGDIVGN